MFHCNLDNELSHLSISLKYFPLSLIEFDLLSLSMMIFSIKPISEACVIVFSIVKLLAIFDGIRSYKFTKVNSSFLT